jgi:methyltransferase
MLTVTLLAFVTLQRLGELLLSYRNTRHLLQRGAIEVAPGHYGLIVALHSAWLIGLWGIGWDQPINLGWLGCFIGLQAARVWVIISLGRRWTTRIIILPGEPLIRSGPYRYLRHPNYLVVIGEIAVLPLALGLLWFAGIFSLLNLAVLAIRVREENRGLRSHEDLPQHNRSA